MVEKFPGQQTGFYIETALQSLDSSMGRGRRAELFGVFDEQAISVLAVLTDREATFTELGRETGLPKASLYRVLKRLTSGNTVKKSAEKYRSTPEGGQVIRLVLQMAREEEQRTAKIVERRVRAIERDYLADHRIFHRDPRWERTADKALVEVMAMRGMTGTASLLFQQRFHEETNREEQKLRRPRTK